MNLFEQDLKKSAQPKLYYAKFVLAPKQKKSYLVSLDLNNIAICKWNILLFLYRNCCWCSQQRFGVYKFLHVCRTPLLALCKRLIYVINSNTWQWKDRNKNVVATTNNTYFARTIEYRKSNWKFRTEENGIDAFDNWFI